MTSRRGLNQFMTYSDAATPPAIAPGSGLLITITDDFGRMIRLTYDAQKRLSTATGIVSAATPVGDIYAYSYDGAGNLSQVTMPDAKTRTYVYERTDLPRLLTGIIDSAPFQMRSAPATTATASRALRQREATRGGQ